MSENNRDVALSVAMMSGKGGVGKSNLSLNLGYALAQLDYPSLLIDADLGLANLDVLLGIAPEKNLQDVMDSNEDVNSILAPIEMEDNKRLSLLPASSGITELVEMNKETRETLFSKIEPVFDNYSMVLLDLGAGIHENVQAFAAMAAIRLIVLTPEPTSLTDAYALIKVLSTNLEVKEFLVIVNQANSQKEAEEIFNRLDAACANFLKVKPVLLGIVRYDSKVSDAVRLQKPLMQAFPSSKAAQDIGSLANKLGAIYGTMYDKLKGKPALDI